MLAVLKSTLQENPTCTNTAKRLDLAIQNILKELKILELFKGA